MYLSFSSVVCQGYFHQLLFLLCLTAENDSVPQYSEPQQEVHQEQGYEHYKDFQPQGRHSKKEQNNQSNIITVGFFISTTNRKSEIYGKVIVSSILWKINL